MKKLLLIWVAAACASTSALAGDNAKPLGFELGVATYDQV